MDVKRTGCSGNTEPHLSPDTALSTRGWLSVVLRITIGIGIWPELENLALISVRQRKIVGSDAG